jgi:hypothetical protein
MNSPLDYIFAAAAAAFAGGPGTFLYQSAEQATLSLNSAQVPAIVLFDYTTSQPTATSKAQSAPLTLYFATSVAGMGDDSEGHHAATEDMRALQRRFFAELDRSPYAQIEGIKATPFAGAFEAQLDGVGIQFTLTIPAGNYCAEAPVEVRNGFPYTLDFALA